jgi:hypothetical protein
LWADGNGPYPAAPRNLLDEYSKGLSDGKMYHAITYGRGQMGSYASQVYPEQRWWIINFIRLKQGISAGAKAPAGMDTTVAAQGSKSTTTTR